MSDIDQPQLIACKDPMVEAQRVPRQKRKVYPKKKKSTPCSQNIGKPKRALSAYNIFFREERRKMLADTSQPNLAFEALGKRVGKMWQNITPEEKVKLEHLAVKEKWRYSMEMGEWRKSQLEEKARALESNTAAPAKETTPASESGGFGVCSGPLEGMVPFQGSNNSHHEADVCLDYNSSLVSTFHGNHMRHISHMHQSSNESGFNRRLVHQNHHHISGSGDSSFMHNSTPKWAPQTTTTAHTMTTAPSQQGICLTSHFCMGSMQMEMRMQMQQMKQQQQQASFLAAPVNNHNAYSNFSVAQHAPMLTSASSQNSNMLPNIISCNSFNNHSGSHMPSGGRAELLLNDYSNSTMMCGQRGYHHNLNSNNSNINSSRINNNDNNNNNNNSDWSPEFDPIPLDSNPIHYGVVRPQRRLRHRHRDEREHIRYLSNNTNNSDRSPKFDPIPLDSKPIHYGVVRPQRRLRRRHRDERERVRYLSKAIMSANSTIALFDQYEH